MGRLDTDRTSHIARLPKFVRFLLVGIANTAASYAVYAFFLMVGLSYVFANLLALILGILISFKTQGIFVFSNTDNWRIFRFVSCWGVIYLFNIWMIAEFAKWGVGPYLAGAYTLPVAALLSYLLQEHFVYSGRLDRQS